MLSTYLRRFNGPCATYFLRMVQTQAASTGASAKPAAANNAQYKRTEHPQSVQDREGRSRSLSRQHAQTLPQLGSASVSSTQVQQNRSFNDPLKPEICGTMAAFLEKGNEMKLNPQALELKNRLFAAQSAGKVVQLYKEAHFQNLMVDMHTLAKVMNACTQLSMAEHKRTAFEIYESLKNKQHVIPESMYMDLLKICRTLCDVTHARDIAHEYRKRYRESSAFYSNLVGAIATREHLGVALREFNRAKKSQISLDDAAMHQLIHESYVGNALAECETILSEYKPKLELCTQLLETAVHRSDLNMISKVVCWVQQELKVPVEHGVLLKMLNCAAREGNITCALTAASFLEANEFQLGYTELRAVALTGFKSTDDVTGVMALQEMHKRRFECDWALLTQLGDMLSCSLARMDRVYYALADLAGKGDVVPPGALQALIVACGKGGHVDRAVATFEEYATVFALPYDVMVCNTLLYATSMAKFKQIQAISSVIQQMQQLNLTPNSRSYEFLIKALLEGAQAEKVEEVLRYMNAESVVPTASTLRTCAREFLKQGMVNASREAVELLREHYRVPDYLKERLRAIAASSEKVEHTHVYSSPASSEQHQHMTHRQ